MYWFVVGRMILFIHFLFGSYPYMLCNFSSHLHTCIHTYIHILLSTQLAEILSTPRNQRSIAWLPHGKSFMILDRQLFVTDILPNYLGKSTKYTSFTRKLSRWKFQRIQDGPEEGAWIHEVRTAMQ